MLFISLNLRALDLEIFSLAVAMDYTTQGIDDWNYWWYCIIGGTVFLYDKQKSQYNNKHHVFDVINTINQILA